jgi:hypothetical protein
MTEALHLPKSVEQDPRATELLRSLVSSRSPLWSGGGILVPKVTPRVDLTEALKRAQRAGHLLRGLESAERALAAEERGLRMADERGSSPRSARVSRLLLLADDGAERFYRHVEGLLRRHGTRVLAVRLEVEAGVLGERLYGPGRIVRLLLVERKEAVSDILLAMVGTGCRGLSGRS